MEWNVRFPGVLQSPEEFMEQFRDSNGDQGKKLVKRNGYFPEGKVQTGITSLEENSKSKLVISCFVRFKYPDAQVFVK